MDRAGAAAVVNEYGLAWEAQDEGRILGIFTPDAVYVERPFSDRGTYRGHEGIRNYWISHIQGHEKDIHFRQIQDDLVFDTEKGVAVAKWEARFSVKRQDGSYRPVAFLQTAKLTFAACGRISHFEEFWHSKPLDHGAKGLYGRREPRRRRPKRRPRDCAVPDGALQALDFQLFGAEEAADRPAAVATIPGAGTSLAPAAAQKWDVGAMDWYRDSVWKAGLAHVTDVAGDYALAPWGAACWQHLCRRLDAELQALGAVPLVLPHLAHAAADDCTSTGSALAARTACEVLLYELLGAGGWVVSHRDLPMLMTRWGAAMDLGVVRQPLPLLRSRELLWQEGHGVHANAADAERFVRDITTVYKQVAEDMLALSADVCRETTEDSDERADGMPERACTTAVVVPIPRLSGRGIKVASATSLGEGPATTFNVRFSSGAEGKGQGSTKAAAWLTSFSFTARALGAAILAHGDALGLILPPHIAPVQVVLLPCPPPGPSFERRVDACRALAASLAPLRFSVDERLTSTPPKKRRIWQQRGAPLVVEVGRASGSDGPSIQAPLSAKLWPRDHAVECKEPTAEVAIEDALSAIQQELRAMHARLLARHQQMSKRVHFG